MAHFTLKQPVTGVPPDRLPDLRKAMSHHIGGQVLELMMTDEDYITGATIHVEQEIIFDGATDTEMGIPFLQVKVILDHKGNDYLRQKKPEKELQS